MSKYNVETARQAIEAWDRRDRAAWLALHDPGCEVVPSGYLPESEAVRGREVAWEFYVSIVSEPFDRFPIGNAEIVDAGADKVLIHHRLAMKGRASGADVETSAWDVVTFREGRIAREQWFMDRAAAVEAAGLQE